MGSEQRHGVASLRHGSSPASSCPEGRLPRGTEAGSLPPKVEPHLGQVVALPGPRPHPYPPLGPTVHPQPPAGPRRPCAEHLKPWGYPGLGQGAENPVPSPTPGF